MSNQIGSSPVLARADILAFSLDLTFLKKDLSLRGVGYSDELAAADVDGVGKEEEAVAWAAAAPPLASDAGSARPFISAGSCIRGFFAGGEDGGVGAIAKDLSLSWTLC